MGLRETGVRRIALVTTGIALTGVAGATVVAMVVDDNATASTSSSSSSTSDSQSGFSDDSGLSSGSGPAHGSSGGS
ncbi:putative membrane protein YgcG [Amycolatopsis bartoniae]|uniref:Uncharacterized protein n=1 Tax=Amycolatopsis bartoniae TaxID=941986 RepID=A0A8H9MB47_9PSEU|nr:hypothetical protein [Amycolatopsis bartoniae]MBB2935825.1 putative membrane protein YgcG [Amycolatopsis bartoniae]TVT04964.1 hypothetical protein FNH07_23275 [Amycolatopsis bartoniae]GHF62118.1 hypothetical protein GCM10017566_39540 [Amycolatopsis bartoniae]